MTTFPRVVTALASSLTVAMLCADPAPALGQTTTNSVIRSAATGKLRPVQLPSLTGIKTAPFISSGTLVTAIDALTLGAADDRQEAADANSPDGTDHGWSGLTKAQRTAITNHANFLLSTVAPNPKSVIESAFGVTDRCPS